MSHEHANESVQPLCRSAEIVGVAAMSFGGRRRKELEHISDHLTALEKAVPEPEFTDAVARLNTVWLNGTVTMNLRFEDLSLLLRAVPAIRALLGRD